MNFTERCYLVALLQMLALAALVTVGLLKEVAVNSRAYFWATLVSTAVAVVSCVCAVKVALYPHPPSVVPVPIPIPDQPSDPTPAGALRLVVFTEPGTANSDSFVWSFLDHGVQSQLATWRLERCGRDCEAARRHRITVYPSVVALRGEETIGRLWGCCSSGVVSNWLRRVKESGTKIGVIGQVIEAKVGDDKDSPLESGSK